MGARHSFPKSSADDRWKINELIHRCHLLVWGPSVAPKKGGEPGGVCKKTGVAIKCPADSPTRRIWMRTLTKRWHHRARQGRFHIASWWLNASKLVLSMLLYLQAWAPVSWIATRLDLRLLRLFKWAWAYTWYTDASNRAGNSLRENWKHQWIFGFIKTKAIYFYIFFHLICLSQMSPNIF